jgi:hypothetical protein
MSTTTQQEQPRCYRIIRFYRDGRESRTIKSNVTEAEAQAHCEREDTREEGVWFDGYDWMKGCRPALSAISAALEDK